MISQDVNKKNFNFVPSFQKYDMEYSDEYFKKIWNLNEEEWDYIDQKMLEAKL